MDKPQGGRTSGKKRGGQEEWRRVALRSSLVRLIDRVVRIGLYRSRGEFVADCVRRRIEELGTLGVNIPTEYHTNMAVRASLVELEGLNKEYGLMCIQIYGMRVDRFTGKGSRVFGIVKDGKICAVAWIHEPHIFEPIFRKFKIDQSNSYFLRRVATCCPGDHAVELLRLLASKLRDEGKEYLVTLGLDDRINSLFRKSGFVEVGRTPRSKHPVFVLKL